MSSSSFCTMGGMGMSDMNHMMHRRKLSESNVSNDSNSKWPVILPGDDDATNADGDEHDKHTHGTMHNGDEDEDKMDGHQHDHQMDHDMNHDKHSGHNNMDHSSHNMPMMSQGTAMYMDGFHSALFSSSSQPPPPCLNLFHPSWTLHTPTKFVFAMIFVTLLGMLVEACGVWRVKCLRRGRSVRREMRLNRLREWEERQNRDMQGQQLEFRRQSQPRGVQHGVSDISDVSSTEGGRPSPPTTTATTSSMKSICCPAIIRRMWRTAVPKCIQNSCARTFITKNVKRYDIAAAALHASRAWLGYLLMLAVMTYSVEFLLSAVLGMVLGRYWFVDMEGSNDNNIAAAGAGGGVMNGAIGVGGGIGGMGLGDAAGGRQVSDQGVGMTDLHGGGNDGTWGGGDPCCGIDDDDEDEHVDAVGSSFKDDMREPLLSSLVGSTNNVGVTRRSGGGLQIDENP